MTTPTTATTRRPEPAYIEILECVEGTDAVHYAAVQGGFIRPNTVRLNGVPLAVPRDESVEVHGITLDADDLVKVTLTLYARRVVIGAEATP